MKQHQNVYYPDFKAKKRKKFSVLDKIAIGILTFFFVFFLGVLGIIIYGFLS